MEGIIVEGQPDDLAVLSDEMSEDPRCAMVLVGVDQQGAILVTIWDPATVDEVEAGLKIVYGSDVRRVRMMDPRVNQ
jgi:hypothetical protein